MGDDFVIDNYPVLPSHPINANLRTFQLDDTFDNTIFEIYNYINQIDGEFKTKTPGFRIFNLSELDLTNIENTILNKYFNSTTLLHKNMVSSPMCNYQIKSTLDEEIEYENKHFGTKMKLNKNNIGHTNSCALRLNNVVPINHSGNNFIIKRYTRLESSIKKDINFLGSACRINPRTGENITLSDFSDEKCEHKELFICLILSKYLRVLYGNICPKIYGLVVINNINFMGKEIQQEIFLISEKMDKTLDDWLRIGHSQEDMDRFVQQTTYITDCIQTNHLPDILTSRFREILYPHDSNKNSLDYWHREDRKIYLFFYDCKPDNIMIDSTNNWRLIDVDGLKLLSDKIIKRTFITGHLTVCSFNDLDSYNPDPDMDFLDLGRYIKPMISNDNLNKLKLSLTNYENDFYSPEKLCFVKNNIFGKIITSINNILGITDTKYQKLYLKYKSKYLNLKKYNF